MSFNIRDPKTGLFWNTGSDQIIRLSEEATEYEIHDDFHVRNVKTGLCVRHFYYVLQESKHGQPEYDFNWKIEESGNIHNIFDGGHYVNIGDDSLMITKDPYAWQIVRLGDVILGPKTVVVDEDDDDVPVSRASALIEEALNASKKCGCECGCEAGCEGCACEEGCVCPEPVPESTPEPAAPEPAAPEPAAPEPVPEPAAPEPAAPEPVPESTSEA